MESKFLTRIAALLVTGIISVTAMFAQSPVSGRVTDAAGNPVAGVFIIAEGTNATASTDSDGNFSLTVPSNTNTLLFQMMGMNDERVAFDRRRARYEVTMTDSQNYLNEAVAIGYGTIIRRDLSTSVSSVSSEKLQERASAFNITQALAGKVAGYSVTNISGRPGGQNTIRIRGRGSISAGSSPLYVVDGVIDVDIDMINANDIESIDVLKDAASTAMYGSKGSNGVVIVTTKSGKRNDGTITFTSTEGVGFIGRTYKEIDGEAYMKAFRDAYAYSGKVYEPYYYTPYEKLFDYAKNPDGSYALDEAGLLIPTPKYSHNWQRDYYQKAFTSENNLSFSKADDRNSVYASVGYKHMGGIIKNTDASRINGTVNFTSKLKPWLDVQFGAIFSSTKQNRNDIMNDGSLYYVMGNTMPSFIPVRYPDGTYGMLGDHLTNASSMDWWSAIERPIRIARNNQIVVNGALNFHLLPGLSLTVKGDFQRRHYQFGQGMPSNILGVTESGGWANVDNNDSMRWSNEDYLSYDRSFFEGRLKTSTVLGTSFYYYHYENAYGGSEHYTDNPYGYYRLQAGPDYLQATSGMDQQTMHSVYARTNLSWEGKYLLGATLRADGASNFGDNNKYGFFPSVSAGWVISEEPWFKQAKDVVSLLKLRASYGSVGNAGIPSYRTFTTFNSGNIIFNKQKYPIVTSGRLGNKDLQWEVSTQYDLGLDVSLWNDRVNLIADFYRRDTHDMLYEKQVPITTGHGSSWTNLGLIRNNGFELTLNAHVIDKGPFQWDLDFIMADNITKVIDVNKDVLYGGSFDMGVYTIRSEEGTELGQFWTYHCLGIWQMDEVDEALKYGRHPGDYKFEDVNHDYIYDDRDRKYGGRVTPKYEFSLVNTFYWKGFSLMIDLAAKTGFDVLCGVWGTQYMSTDGVHEPIRWAWTPNNQGTLVPANRTGGDYFGTIDTGDQDIYKGDFLKIRNIALSYDLKRDLFKNNKFFKGMSIGVNAENVATFTRVPARDIEDAGWGNTFGAIGGTYPKPITVSGTVKLIF